MFLFFAKKIEREIVILRNIHFRHSHDEKLKLGLALDDAWAATLCGGWDDEGQGQNTSLTNGICDVAF